MEATDYFMVCGSNGAGESINLRLVVGQMTSHMEEPRRKAALVGKKILISARDYERLKVRIINNSGGSCIISHCANKDGKCR